jgi:ligand-binding sensor domain-containing protein
MKHIGWFGVLTLLMPCLLVAQEPHFIFHDVGEANTNTAIRTVFQDHNGMIWLGTDHGLAKYTGVIWQSVDLPGAKEMLEVTAIAEDSKQRLWIGAADGSIYYRDSIGVFHQFDIEEGLPAKKITAILEDGEGQLWFATYGEGVYVYSANRLFNIDSTDGLSGNDIYTMIRTPDEAIWLGTDDGISICRFQQEVKHVNRMGLKEGLPDQIITSLLSDSHGNVMIGTFEFGIVYFDAKARKIIRPAKPALVAEVTAMGLFDDNEFWFGTREHGVWRYAIGWPDPRRIVSLDQFKLSAASAIMTDVEGNIWITPVDGGLVSCFRPFEKTDVPIGDIQSVFADHADSIWIGTKKGLYKLRQHATRLSEAVVVPVASHLNISAIIEDRFHQLWLGTLDQGLCVFNPKTNKLVSFGSVYQKGGISIMSMSMSDSVIWIATLEGVIAYPADKNILQDANKEFTVFTANGEEMPHFVYHVFVDSKKRTWFSTDGNGVVSLAKGKLQFHRGNDSIDMRTVFATTEDHNGHLWFSVDDIGLVEFDGESYKALSLNGGLGNLNIESIAPVGTGDLVMAHARGIDVMEPDRRHFMYYDNEIGANTIEPGLNAITRNRHGDVYIGCKNRIYAYYASQHKLSIHPHTQITRVAVFEEDVDFRSVNTFSHAQDYFTFDYAGLWYTSPASVTYQYMLEGYDRQWKQSKDNVASYAHLSPGTYTFYVKASENKFFLDEPTASYTFTIRKPFWLEWWFVATVSLAAGALMYWLIKSRERRSERQALLKKEMVESQLSALRAQINPHFLFNSFNTLITIIDENAREPGVAIEYVEKLSDFYRSILQYREQESISLEEEFAIIRNFGYLLEKRYGNYLRLHLDTPPTEGRILPLTLQILVENAVKHNVISAKNPLDVYITVDADDYVTIKNSLQPKSKSEPSTQFGLHSIIKQYQLLTDRRVIVTDGPEVFVVRIPIIKRTRT